MWIILPQKGKSFLDCALSMKFTYYLMLINHETKKKIKLRHLGSK